MPQFFESDTKC